MPAASSTRTLAALAALHTLALGCSDEATPIAVEVRIAVDAATCGAADPGPLPLDCAGELGVWLLGGDGQTARASRCVSLAPEPGRGLVDLPGLLRAAEVEFDDLADGDAVAVEVAVYSPTTGASCPRFDPGAFVTPVYFGRSPVVALSGDRPVIPITIFCVSLPAPSAPTCDDEPLPDQYEIAAAVTDLETLSPLAPALRDQVTVSFGDAYPVAPGFPGIFAPLAQLVRDGTGAIWRGTLAAPPSLSGCPATAVALPGQGTSVLSCQAETSENGWQIDTVGYHVDLANVPALTELGAEFGRGVALGRVVDSAGAPIAGAVVEALDGDATVFYLSEDRLTFFESEATASHGYFLVYAIDGDGCCHTLTAVTADGIRTGTSLGPVALVQNALTAVLVQIQ